MKSRKGWIVTSADGSNWYGDCPNWAAVARGLGQRVTSLRIYGGRPWACGCSSTCRSR